MDAGHPENGALIPRRSTGMRIFAAAGAELIGGALVVGEAAGILLMEFVDIRNKNSGVRIST